MSISDVLAYQHCAGSMISLITKEFAQKPANLQTSMRLCVHGEGRGRSLM